MDRRTPIMRNRIPDRIPDRIPEDRENRFVVKISDLIFDGEPSDEEPRVVLNIDPDPSDIEAWKDKYNIK
ncbi:MAG: hypothetical protein AB1656_05060 [Candidatus Omnitrophota bacterium]